MLGLLLTYYLHLHLIVLQLVAAKESYAAHLSQEIMALSGQVGEKIRHGTVTKRGHSLASQWFQMACLGLLWVMYGFWWAVDGKNVVAFSGQVGEKGDFTTGGRHTWSRVVT